MRSSIGTGVLRVGFFDDDSYLSQDIGDVDPAVARLIGMERDRQGDTLEMIASENFTSQAVLQAAGSVLTNKYAEGLPGRRYYGGCEVVDEVETLAIERARLVFGAQHANVQPHSGSTANEAASAALIKPGDRVLAMALAHGGHLSHGLNVNFSGRLYAFHHYGVRREDCRIHMEDVRALAREHRPALIVAGASAYPRVIDFPAFRDIADEVGAKLLVDMAHIAGLVAAGVHPSPVGIADVVTTTTHKTLGGPRAGIILSLPEYAQAVDRAVFPGLQGGPLMHVIAAKAVALGHALTEEFRHRQRQVVANCQALAEALLQGGVDLVSGGTDNHLVLVDLSRTPLTGKDGEARLDAVGITVNKNGVPFDERPPTVTSGIRIGSAALTTRGLREPEFRRIGSVIAMALGQDVADGDLSELRSEMRALGERFPLYPRLSSGTAVMPV
ncbi:MAG: serine hydroxymethyltransferase [Actinobacteria bacterium]|nr:serine hydroxymethyltransferase [Actinomycetota bacterium]